MGGKRVRARPGCLPQELELSASAPPEFRAILPGGGAERAGLPSLWLPSPASQRLSHPVSGLIFHASEWKRDYNENLCVFGVRLVSQCGETRSRLPIFIFHSRFGEHSRARGERVCSVAG